MNNPPTSSYNVELGKWVLEEPYTYESALLDVNGEPQITLDIPEHTVWDKATIPWPARIVIAKEELGDKATLVHDLLYAAKGKIQGEELFELSREEVDILFYHDMKELGVSWWKRELAYWCVRWFGGTYWEDEG